MTEIWFIRHGETSWNVQRRMQGWQDIALNETGLAQADQLAQRLGNDASKTQFDAIYSSDLQRAHATALPVSQELGLRIRTEPGLRERGFGILEGIPLDQIEQQAPEAAAIWQQRIPDATLEGGESLAQFRSRIVAAVQDIAQRHTGERVLAVTHGGVLDVIWREANGVDLSTPRTASLLNASINRIAIDERQWRMIDWGDVAHIGPTAINDVTA